MRFRGTARSSILALVLAAGLTIPPAAWSVTTEPPPPPLDLEWAEELGYDVDDPALDDAIAEAEAADVSATPAGAPTADEDAVDVFAEESETGLWIVQLEGEPLATYEGDAHGLGATSIRATGEERLDVSSTESRAYLDHLEGEHATLLAAMTDEVGHEVEVTQTYHHVLNGMTIRASAEEAAAYAELPGVAQVFPDEIHQLETDVSNEIIASPSIWQGATGSGLATQGEGVIVGMIDSGVNPHHPSFAATDGEGYTHTNPYGAGTYVGLCDPDDEDHQDVCNDKLVGVYNYTSATWEDTDGHGSHVGSTMAGNTHQAQFEVGSTEWDLTVQGVAPRANVISYKICAPGCATSYAVAAVNQAVEDGVDVLNYSISGPDNPWGNAVDLAFLDAFEAGIFVAASAGNTGPLQGTVTKTAPWNATVAASNSPRLIAQALRVEGPTPVPEGLEEVAAVPGTGPAVTSPISAEVQEIPDNVPGCTTFEDGAFDGTLALIERGGCDFSVKVENAAAAGAVGVVMTNQVPGPPIVMGALEDTTIPAVMVAYDEGAQLREFVREHDNRAQIVLDSASTLTQTPAWSSIVADFSGRGPSRYDLLNPTFTAPGRNILAATAADGDDAAAYEFMQGTSMASPHGAGSGALLRGLHPDWSPAMIRSALASTADQVGMLKDDGVTAADAFDVGSGLLDLDAAGRVGLVMDETTENFRAANPSQGGDPRTLNLPAIVDGACDGTCTFERELTNVADVRATYSVDLTGSAPMAVDVEPAVFTVDPGESQVITVTVDVQGSSPADGWHFGEVTISTEATHAQGAAIADVNYPVTVLAVNPVMGLTPTSLSSTMGVDHQTPQTVTISNTGSGPLNWQVSAEPAGCTSPAWISVVPESGQLPAPPPLSRQNIEVIFDTTDMAEGTYEGTVCIVGDDPASPVVPIELSLTVVEIPALVVDPTDVTVTQAADSAVTSTIEVTNAGYGTLEWTLEDAAAGPSEERVEMLRAGVLLTPAHGAPRNVVALDGHDGTLVDDGFIPTMSSGTNLMVLPLPDKSGVLVSDQLGSVVNKYDLDGNYVGVFAPRHGMDVNIMRNIRGMAWSPQGTLVVTASGFTGDPNRDTLLEFDEYGHHLGLYVEHNLDEMASPWFPLFRDNDLLVAATSSRAIHSFSLDGTEVNPRFTTETNYPVQLDQTEDGTVLSAVWSTRTGYLPAGVHEFDADGELLWSAQIPGASSASGVHELGNGNMLVSTDDGVYELDREGAYDLKWGERRTRLISEAHMPDLQTCQVPSQVGWLEVDQVAGENGRQTSSTVSITTDSTGMEVGEHTAQLCVSSNDPVRPYVPVDVSMTVEATTCDTTIDGRVNGGLTVDGVVCVEPGAVINGGVVVRAGATLQMDGAQVNGGLHSFGADRVEVTGSSINGGVTITGTTQVLVFEDNVVKGRVRIYDNPAVD